VLNYDTSLTSCANRRQHNGEAGVDLAIKLLMDEFKITMALSGSVISLEFCKKKKKKKKAL
jgi:hypothetical protein